MEEDKGENMEGMEEDVGGRSKDFEEERVANEEENRFAIEALEEENVETIESIESDKMEVLEEENIKSIENLNCESSDKIEVLEEENVESIENLESETCDKIEVLEEEHGEIINSLERDKTDEIDKEESGKSIESLEEEKHESEPSDKIEALEEETGEIFNSLESVKTDEINKEESGKNIEGLEEEKAEESLEGEPSNKMEVLEEELIESLEGKKTDKMEALKHGEIINCMEISNTDEIENENSGGNIEGLEEGKTEESLEGKQSDEIALEREEGESSLESKNTDEIEKEENGKIIEGFEEEKRAEVFEEEKNKVENDNEKGQLIEDGKTESCRSESNEKEETKMDGIETEKVERGQSIKKTESRRSDSIKDGKGGTKMDDIETEKVERGQSIGNRKDDKIKAKEVVRDGKIKDNKIVVDDKIKETAVVDLQPVVVKQELPDESVIEVEMPADDSELSGAEKRRAAALPPEIEEPPIKKMCLNEEVEVKKKKRGRPRKVKIASQDEFSDDEFKKLTRKLMGHDVGKFASMEKRRKLRHRKAKESINYRKFVADEVDDEEAEDNDHEVSQEADYLDNDYVMNDENVQYAAATVAPEPSRYFACGTCPAYFDNKKDLVDHMYHRGLSWDLGAHGLADSGDGPKKGNELNGAVDNKREGENQYVQIVPDSQNSKLRVVRLKSNPNLFASPPSNFIAPGSPMITQQKIRLTAPPNGSSPPPNILPVTFPPGVVPSGQLQGIRFVDPTGRLIRVQFKPNATGNVASFAPGLANQINQVILSPNNTPTAFTVLPTLGANRPPLVNQNNLPPGVYNFTPNSIVRPSNVTSGNFIVAPTPNTAATSGGNFTVRTSTGTPITVPGHNPTLRPVMATNPISPSLRLPPLTPKPNNKYGGFYRIRPPVSKTSPVAVSTPALSGFNPVVSSASSPYPSVTPAKVKVEVADPTDDSEVVPLVKVKAEPNSFEPTAHCIVRLPKPSSSTVTPNSAQSTPVPPKTKPLTVGQKNVKFITKPPPIYLEGARPNSVATFTIADQKSPPSLVRPQRERKARFNILKDLVSDDDDATDEEERNKTRKEVVKQPEGPKRRRHKPDPTYEPPTATVAVTSGDVASESESSESTCSTQSDEKEKGGKERPLKGTPLYAAKKQLDDRKKIERIQNCRLLRLGAVFPNATPDPRIVQLRDRVAAAKKSERESAMLKTNELIERIGQLRTHGSFVKKKPAPPEEWLPKLVAVTSQAAESNLVRTQKVTNERSNIYKAANVPIPTLTLDVSKL